MESLSLEVSVKAYFLTLSVADFPVVCDYKKLTLTGDKFLQFNGISKFFLRGLKCTF